MGVVRLLRSDNAAPGRDLPRNPQRFKVCQGAAGGKMAQKFGPAKHLRNLGHCLDLHLGAGAASVAGVVVRIDRHGQRIGGTRHRVWRLEHLPGIKGMEIGIVVAQPVRRFLKHTLNRASVDSAFRRRCEGWKRAKLRLQHLGGAGQQAGYRIVEHSDSSPYHTQR